MNRTVPLARHRRAPLSDTLTAARPLAARDRVEIAATDDFQPTWFAPAQDHERGFAPTQFVERRRFPRQPHASLGRLLEQPSLPAAGTTVASASASAMSAMSSMTAMAAKGAMACMSATADLGQGGFAFAGGGASFGAQRPVSARTQRPASTTMNSSSDDSGFGHEGLDFPVARGLRGIVSRVERVLDRLLSSPLGTMLALFVCIALAMAVMSALLPLIDLR